MTEKFTVISAGAGSGKTYRLTRDLVQLLQSGVRAKGIIATTFTKKAAAELQERVRVKLLEEGLTTAADELSDALIGTVHSLGVKLLRRFAFEAGVSPQVEIIAEEDQQFLFNQSLAMVLTPARIEMFDMLSVRLGQSQDEAFEWRKDIHRLADMARANDFTPAMLGMSKKKSVETIFEIFGDAVPESSSDVVSDLENLLDSTISTLKNNEKDTTVKTKTALSELIYFRRQLQLNGRLDWNQWLKMARIDVAVKSRDIVEPLIALAWRHEGMKDFRQDIRDYLEGVFDMALEAILEYGRYKQKRGLIDYNDMEVLVKKLLSDAGVQDILRQELDLLMVDEFQDTNPVQLEIFLKLSALSKYAIWVGDPKQSIYGFRGADPELMQAVIKEMGGIREENILATSWRSREDIVLFTNAVFMDAFAPMPPAQVVLKAERSGEKEPPGPGQALIHWFFQQDLDPAKVPGRPWPEMCIAQALTAFLAQPPTILPKGASQYRSVLPGDIAILCRNNDECIRIASALHQSGLKAATSRFGLMGTAEAKLILACLRYLLSRHDSLAVAELLLLAEARHIEDIVCDRLDFLIQAGDEYYREAWAKDVPIIQQLDQMREQIADFSSAEILNLILEECDLRRIIAAWGNVPQRLGNVEVLRKCTLEYEDACLRLHSAASLGGFLLWLMKLEKAGKDFQYAGTQPDAVNVLTYHKSKGLEWPVVICFSLDSDLKDSVWGMQILSDAAQTDLYDLQKGRWIRFWSNPYGKSNSNRVSERLEENTFQQAATRRALEEEVRLLYVGLTRARDYLILPTNMKPARWLNRVCNGAEGASHQVLDFNNPASTWEYEGREIRFHKERFLFPREFPHSLPAQTPIYFTEHSNGPVSHELYYIDPFDPKEDIDITGIGPGDPLYYAAAVHPPEGIEDDQLLIALRAMQNGYRRSYNRSDCNDMAHVILSRLHLRDDIDPEIISRQTEALYAWLEKTYAPINMLHRYPVRYHRNGRFFETVIDLILETADGRRIIIQHHDHASTQSLQRKAKAWAAWFQLSTTAVKTIWNPREVIGYLHFPLESALVPLT